MGFGPFFVTSLRVEKCSGQKKFNNSYKPERQRLYILINQLKREFLIP